MLSKLDDHIGHQLPTTFDHVATSDSDWCEQFGFSIIDTGGRDTILAAGLSHYPNKGVQEGFAGVNQAGKQINLRLSRALRPRIGETAIGPLRFHVLEPMERHLLVLGENDSRLSFEFESHSTMNPHEEGQRFRRVQGRVVEDRCGYMQLGRAKGVVRMPDGRELRLEPERHFVQRWHWWGIEPAGQRPAERRARPLLYVPTFYCSGAAQFERFGLHWSWTERSPGQFVHLSGEIVKPLGQPAGPDSKLSMINHDFKWDTGCQYQLMKQAFLELVAVGDEKLQVTITGLPARYQLRAAFYGGQEEVNPGDYRGEYYFEHDLWDLAQPETQRRAGSWGDQLIELETHGGAHGWGVTRYGVMPGYARYSEVQELPYM